MMHPTPTFLGIFCVQNIDFAMAEQISLLLKLPADPKQVKGRRSRVECRCRKRGKRSVAPLVVFSQNRAHRGRNVRRHMGGDKGTQVLLVQPPEVHGEHISAMGNANGTQRKAQERLACGWGWALGKRTKGQATGVRRGSSRDGRVEQGGTRRRVGSPVMRAMIDRLCRA